MEKRNLIIGGFTHYGINQLKPWVLSAKEVADENTHIVLVYGHTSKETLNWLEEQGVLLWPMDTLPNVPPHVMRFHSLHEFLRIKGMEYDYVVATDVKDVYFQSNPFEALKGHKLVVATEGLKYKDEPWGRENLLHSYGPYVYEHFKENEISVDSCMKPIVVFQGDVFETDFELERISESIISIAKKKYICHITYEDGIPFAEISVDVWSVIDKPQSNGPKK